MTVFTYQPHNVTPALDLEHDDPNPWMGRSECRGLTEFTELPVPEQKEVCGPCPVRSECIEYALDVEGPTALRNMDTICYGGLTGAEVFNVSRRRAATRKRAA